LLEEFDLEIVAHQYLDADEPERYGGNLRASLENAARFNPLVINSHTGKDWWSMEENLQGVEIGREVERSTGVPIVHETHRGRFLYSAPVSRAYFKACEALLINADFSHWTCVSESLLEDQQDVVEEGIQRSRHIHARVGHAQGPQVPDPRAPEWKTELDTFTGWWQRIVDVNRDAGRELLTITPEYGPAPYTWLWPRTQKPAGDFFEINCWMKDYLRENLKTG